MSKGRKTRNSSKRVGDDLTPNLGEKTPSNSPKTGSTAARAKSPAVAKNKTGKTEKISITFENDQWNKTSNVPKVIEQKQQTTGTPDNAKNSENLVPAENTRNEHDRARSKSRSISPNEKSKDVGDRGETVVTPINSPRKEYVKRKLNEEFSPESQRSRPKKRKAAK